MVSSLSQLQSAINSANPGDRIELTNGVYTASSSISINRSGTATAPIVIAAQNVGGAEIRGSSGFSLGGVSYVAIEGFRLMHSGSTNIPGNAHHVKFRRNVVQLTSGGNWVTVTGHDNEVGYNTFQNRSSEGVFLQVSGPGANDMAQRTWIHHNYFFNHTFSGANGGESIRLGYSYRNLSSAFATVEYNLFVQANGDSEAISVKSSDNVIRYNTLRNSEGWIVLRHGNRNRVEGNIGLGSGIRYYDNDHVIVNNLVQNSHVIAGSGTIIDDTSGSTAHARPDRVLFAFNTIRGSGTLLEIGSGNTYGPDNCTWANNIFQGSGSGALVDVSKGSNLRWQGNIIWGGTGGDMPSSGYRSVNPGLITDSGGLYRLGSASSPAVDTAAGSYPQVTLDFDLFTRAGANDVGADEFTSGGTQRRPLTTADVGPNAP
ncbi:MAG TPA: lyase [Micromonosporaceae bacterium]|nr:lyase [Micromonosporaceae bacterium]